MENRAKIFSPAIFGIIILCFFFPFIKISCQGQKVASLTGIQLVTGTTIMEPSMIGIEDIEPGIGRIGEEEKGQKLNGELWAVLAFLSAIIGLGLSFLKGRKSAIATAITGVAGFLLFLLLKAKLDNDILRQGQGMLQANYGAGFYLPLLLFLSAIGVNVYSMAQSKGISLLQGKGFATVSVKSKEAIETIKIKSQIGALQEQKKSDLEELGNIVYIMFRKGSFDKDRFREKCETISRLDSQIKNKEEELRQIHLKAQEALANKRAVGVCSCGAKIYEYAKFCDKCGKKV